MYARYLDMADVPAVSAIHNTLPIRNDDYDFTGYFGVVVSLGEYHPWISFSDYPVVGYVYARLSMSCVICDWIAVHPDHRKQGVARLLVEELRRLRDINNKKSVVFRIPEQCMDVHMFLKSMGVPAIHVEHDTYIFVDNKDELVSLTVAEEYFTHVGGAL
jgi:GNAT superfamily N-acetyltransferase